MVSHCLDDAGSRGGLAPYPFSLRKLVLVAAVLIAVAAETPISAAASGTNYKTAVGLSVYLGVVPAAIVRGHPKGHAEEAMHGGVPHGPHAYHVIIALFDAKTGERVEDAAVEARVSPLGLAGITRRLEPMTIAGTVTYGNYFTLRDADTYRIALTITRPAARRPVTTEFTYERD